LKKVLIITYYWPPAGGPGVQRVLKFVKYLPEFGWEPLVLTADKGEYPAIDEELSEEIPPNLKVYKTKSLELFSLYKRFSGKKNNIPTHILSSSSSDSFFQKFAKWIRANIMLPDARIGWIPSIIKEGRKIIKNEKPDLIFSSSPPHSLQIGTMKLAKRTKLKWVADFRDPWRNAFWQNDIKRNLLSKRIEKRNETAVIKSADAVTTVSKSLAEDFKKIEFNKYFIITNGYDESDFNSIEKEDSDKFRINYTGTLSKDQKIENLLSALDSLPDDLKRSVELNFYGSVHNDIAEEIDQFDLKGIINLREGVSHKEVIRIMKNSELLLLVIPDTVNNLGIVTGKIFEYLATRNFVLGIGPEKGDAAKILNETKCGMMFNYQDDLTGIILEQISMWQNKKSNVINEEAVRQYSRKNITEKLANIFREVL